MKSIISLVLAGVLASSLVCADNLTEKNVAAANEVIDAALEAHAPGGKLEDLGTLIIEFDRVVYSFGQSRGTEPPQHSSR
jgi:predicted amino acid dehydrogenase